jgi:hypothetical protein
MLAQCGLKRLLYIIYEPKQLGLTQRFNVTDGVRLTGGKNYQKINFWQLKAGAIHKS